MESITCSTCKTMTMILVRSLDNTFWCGTCQQWRPCPRRPTGNALDVHTS